MYLHTMIMPPLFEVRILTWCETSYTNIIITSKDFNRIHFYSFFMTETFIILTFEWAQSSCNHYFTEIYFLSYCTQTFKHIPTTKLVFEALHYHWTLLYPVKHIKISLRRDLVRASTDKRNNKGHIKPFQCPFGHVIPVLR